MEKLFISTGYLGDGRSLALGVSARAHFELRDVEALEQWRRDLAAQPEPSGVGYDSRFRRPSRDLIEALDAWLTRQAGAQPLLLADERDLWLLDFWAEHRPEAGFLLFYTAPEAALVEALLQGEEPQRSMADWQAAAQHLMRFQRRHRRRSVLLDAEAARLDPQAMAVAAQRIGLILPVEPHEAPARDQHVLERLLARRWLATQGDFALLQAELEACAHPLGEPPPTPELGAEELLRQYRHQQLRQRQQLAEAEVESKRAQERLQALEKRLKEVAKENELLLSQLHQVQEELESQFLEGKRQRDTFSAEKSGLEREKTALEAERDKQRHLAAERQRKLQALEDQHQDTKEENELLLLQLHQVQEELEQYFLKYQELAARSDQGRAEAAEVTSATEASSSSGAAAATQSRTRKRGQRKRPPALKPRGPFAKNRKERRRLERYVAIIRESGLFDEEWYLRQYSDVLAAGFDAVEHYVCHGVPDGRNPAPWFDTRFYLDSNPDVAASIMNPLVHYHRFGKAEGRPTRPGW
ncbi:hypothetical protein [Thiorhodococcus minor]|uniref:Uncharacterized protein n=1 Tax=Thiorhodococcus minor TaxID=57489 RepID=A0A6M0JW37_9GAMM|nr:hypothetical protein [Thiorhodococcus minor]NEV61131.1 hypothetical protein [Thiorhodococcus minor]